VIISELPFILYMQVYEHMIIYTLCNKCTEMYPVCECITYCLDSKMVLEQIYADLDLAKLNVLDNLTVICFCNNCSSSSDDENNADDDDKEEMMIN
jgi:hypothetical protein